VVAGSRFQWLSVVFQNTILANLWHLRPFLLVGSLIWSFETHRDQLLLSDFASFHWLSELLWCFGCTTFKVYVFWFCGSCTSVGISIFVPFDVGCWFSSSIGVGFTGTVSGDGISSTLMISYDYFSPSSACTRDLVWTLVFLAVWITSSCFGGSMVINVECLMGLASLCDLCELVYVLLNLYFSLSVLFFANRLFVPTLVCCMVYAWSLLRTLP